MRIAGRLLIGLLVAGSAAAAAVFLAFRPPGGTSPALEGSFRLSGVELIEPGIRRLPGAALEVRDGALASVAATDPPIPHGKSSPEGQATDLEELRGSFVLPGLLDLHTHLPTDSPLALTRYFGLLYVAHGVTTVRDAGDLDATAFPAARRIFDEEGRVGPRSLSCGPFVGGPGPRWAHAIVVERADQAGDIVEQLIDDGNGCIKIYDGLDVERIRALVRAAQEAGLPAIGHVPYALTFEEARVPNTQHLMGVARPEQIAAGNQVIHRIMDWSQVDDARIREVVQASVELGIVHTPTLVSGYELRRYRDLAAARADPAVRVLPRFFRDVVWDPTLGIRAYRTLTPEDLALFEGTLEKKLRMMRQLHEAGVELRVGTDTQQPFVAPGSSVWTEMRLWERAGIPVEEIWAYATWKGAVDTPVPMLGRLVEGAPADFLVFAEDPTRSLDALDSLRAVVVRGRLYRRDDLDAAIEAYRAFYERWLVDALSVRIAKARLAATAD